MPTALDIGYDDLQPIARPLGFQIEPLLVRKTTGQMAIGCFDGLYHALIERLNLGVTLDDMTPPLLSQLDLPPLEVRDRRSNRHAGDDRHIYRETVVNPPLACPSFRCGGSRTRPFKV